MDINQIGQPEIDKTISLLNDRLSNVYIVTHTNEAFLNFLRRTLI